MGVVNPLVGRGNWITMLISSLGYRHLVGGLEGFGEFGESGVGLVEFVSHSLIQVLLSIFLYNLFFYYIKLLDFAYKISETSLGARRLKKC